MFRFANPSSSFQFLLLDIPQLPLFALHKAACQALAGMVSDVLAVVQGNQILKEQCVTSDVLANSGITAFEKQPLSASPKNLF